MNKHFQLQHAKTGLWYVKGQGFTSQARADAAILDPVGVAVVKCTYDLYDCPPIKHEVKPPATHSCLQHAETGLWFVKGKGFVGQTRAEASPLDRVELAQARLAHADVVFDRFDCQPDPQLPAK